MHFRYRLHRRPAIALWPALLLFAACATQQAAPRQPPRSAGANLQQLADRDRILTSLQTAAVMEYSGPDGHIKARERISVRRPADIRVEALSPIGVALVITANKNEVAVFDPAKNTIARGPATAATLARVAHLPLEPEQATRLLLALTPDASMLSKPAASASDGDNATTLSYPLAGGANAQLDFGGGNLMAVRQQAADGSPVYEVRYSDYRDIGGLGFPHTIEARFPPTGTTLKFRFDLPQIDGSIPDSAFVLNPGPQTRELELGFNLTPLEPRG